MFTGEVNTSIMHTVYENATFCIWAGLFFETGEIGPRISEIIYRQSADYGPSSAAVRLSKDSIFALPGTRRNSHFEAHNADIFPVIQRSHRSRNNREIRRGKTHVKFLRVEIFA